MHTILYSFRNSETSSIKNKHYHRNCEGTSLHDRVYLVNRKGWTHESGNTVAAIGQCYTTFGLTSHSHSYVR